MASTTAITSQTTAATSSDITVASGSTIQIWADGNLAVGEEVSLFRTNGGSPDVEVEVRDIGGEANITKWIPSVVVSGPGIFRIKKPVTATAVAIYYDS